jgi:hypothetical protein
MLKIKATQMRALGSEARRRFEASAIALLREEFPQNNGDRPDDELRQFVCEGIQRAKVYGISAVTDVERWLRLMVRLGPEFDEDARYPALRAILDEREASAEQRMDAVEAAAAHLGERRR